MAAPNKANHLFSSFTFKFLLALVLVAVVPVGTAFIIFGQISDFNQKLQKEAVDSIEGVSEIYRAWLKNESERILLIQDNLMLQIDVLLDRYQLYRIKDMRNHAAFKKDLERLFEKTIEENHQIFDIRLNINMKPLVSVTIPMLDRNKYKLHAASRPLLLRRKHIHAGTEENDSLPAAQIPLLVAQPVEDGDDDSEERGDDEISLPQLLNDGPSSEIKMSQRGVDLVMLLGIEREKSELYQRLGEKRYLHGSIMAIDSDQETSVVDIYQMIFGAATAIVFIMIMALALGISMPMTRRITALARATQTVASGDLNAKVEVTGNDQIAELMRQFNYMLGEVQKAQESKAYIERMQAWQEVARRLAHEIKNPLTPIVLAVQQLDRKFDDYTDRPQKYRKLLTDVVEIVNEETETLRKLVKNFSEFARMPIPEKKTTKFVEFVRQTIAQNAQFAEQASIEVIEPDAAVSSIFVDIDHELMRRVLVNLVRNGIEASSNAGYEPEIRISFEMVQTEAQNNVCVSVIDNGPGLTDEQKAKLFMPYFTTKSDGTGLGLAIVRKIVEDHNGVIRLGDRRDGARGTQADIELTPVDEAESAEA